MMSSDPRSRRTANRATAAARTVRVLALLLCVFLVLPPGSAMAQSVRLAQADAAEISFWESVKDSTSPAELEAYLKAYPQGTFAALARIRLDALKKSTMQPGAVPEPAGGGTAALAPEHECDRLWASPVDPDWKAKGVPFKLRDAERTAQACEQAVAAHPGVPRFEYQLGRALQQAKGYGEALQWYRKAADKNYAPAMFHLAIMYANGIGVASDYARAVEWHRKAADQGMPLAMLTLGLIYENGRLGVTRDRTEALRWIRKAAEQRDELAIKLLRNRGESIPAPVSSKPDKAETPSGFGDLTPDELLKLD